MSYNDKLNAIIERFLNGSLSLAEFQTEYTRQFIDEIPDDGLTALEWEMYGAIHERTESTALNPTTEDKQAGWMNEGQLREWLNGQAALKRSINRNV